MTFYIQKVKGQLNCDIMLGCIQGGSLSFFLHFMIFFYLHISPNENAVTPTIEVVLLPVSACSLSVCWLVCQRDGTKTTKQIYGSG